MIIKYGVAVLRGWMVKGVIRAKCLEKKIRGMPAEASRDFDFDTADELAGESVARALEPFRVKALMGGKWDPRRGAAMKTYFVTGCLIKSVDVLAGWVRHERDVEEELRLSRVPRDLLAPGLDLTPLDRDVIEAEATAALLGPATRREARQAMVMQTMGWKVSEIAAHLDMTVKSVEKMIEYAKHQLRRGA